MHGQCHMLSWSYRLLRIPLPVLGCLGRQCARKDPKEGYNDAYRKAAYHGYLIAMPVPLKTVP